MNPNIPIPTTPLDNSQYPRDYFTSPTSSQLGISSLDHYFQQASSLFQSLPLGVPPKNSQQTCCAEKSPCPFDYPQETDPRDLLSSLFHNTQLRQSSLFSSRQPWCLFSNAHSLNPYILYAKYRPGHPPPPTILFTDLIDALMWKHHIFTADAHSKLDEWKQGVLDRMESRRKLVEDMVRKSEEEEEDHGDDEDEKG
ncbi:hypothetical protein DL95DRAFT_483970 [Leptodontidium sp. 2 PMI_412]|nr:hypothetical protein DL95DRAFT_483970 [Leptodontidium sp. 2 PMI_412]